MRILVCSRFMIKNKSSAIRQNSEREEELRRVPTSNNRQSQVASIRATYSMAEVDGLGIDSD